MICTRSELRGHGQCILDALPATEQIERWRRVLAEYAIQGAYAADDYAWLSCVLALEAVAQGNFGVGAVLAAADGSIVAAGHNALLHPYFRSDRHAEMVVLDAYEDACRAVAPVDPLTLYTSLEPCPMCFVRLSSSAVSVVRYVAVDAEGGMVRTSAALPVFWQTMAANKQFAPASCAPELVNVALQLFQLNLEALSAAVRAAPDQYPQPLFP